MATATAATFHTGAAPEKILIAMAGYLEWLAKAAQRKDGVENETAIKAPRIMIPARTAVFPGGPWSAFCCAALG